MNKKDGGAAFPRKLPDVAVSPERALEIIKEHAGMSLRDYFAAKAMATFLAGAVLPTKADREEWLPKLAEVAYESADAMLKARSV